MREKRFFKHRIIRWLIQGCFLILFLILFYQTRYPVTDTYVSLFFKFDPLVFIVFSIAYRAITAVALFSISLIIGSLIFGRFFCGFVCPLGTTIDIFGVFIINKNKHGIALKNLKYLILLFLAVAAILGISFLHFFDPLTILERSLTLVLYPTANFFLGFFVNLPNVLYVESLIALTVFIVIIGLEFVAPRFWCRNLCALGGLYAVFAKFAVLKFIFRDDCSECGVCTAVCPTGAIDFKAREIDSGECIDCLRCQYECPTKVINYRFNFGFLPFDIKRRELIMATAAGLILAPLAKSLFHVIVHGHLIRPPGSIPESHFLNRCIRCGKCMKVCLTNGLQPCILESGINGLWTPRLVPRIGGCEKDCNMCGQVCPTSAIRKLDLEEKSYVHMGTAAIDRSRCIAWEQDKLCLICDEACPYNAINSREETLHGIKLLRPFVDERICTGCGLCEARCPIEGISAIQTFSMSEERKMSGSYITEEKKRWRQEVGKIEDIPSGFILK